MTFHSLDDQNSVISFPPILFEHGMAYLHQNGYRTLALEKLVNCMQHGDPLPKRSLAITFDDGYQSVYDYAFPTLQRFGFSATVYLTTGKKREGRLPFTEGRPMLSWSEIREMHRSGISFGAHTLTHPDLTCLPAELIETEIVSSKSAIEDALSSAVETFAYPYGRYDNRCREIVSRHFLCACSDRLGLYRFPGDRFAMERIDAYYLRTMSLFQMLVSPFFPLYISARAIPRRIRRVFR